MRSLTRRLAALAAGALVGVAVSSAAAQAAPASSSAKVQVSKEPGAAYQTSDGWCHFKNWGGNWYCKGTGVDVVYWKKPDGYPQVFVLGTNRHMYSRWSTASGTSEWLDMKGLCSPDYGLLAHSSGWSITINCWGDNNAWWHNTRATSGSWTGWKPGRA